MNRPGFVLGYNTNGFAHHRLDDAIDVLAEIGYCGIAITLDVAHLDPARVSRAEIARVRRKLESRGLQPVIETGARFLLDPRRKHRPTLLDDDWRPRMAFLRACLSVARALGAPVLSVWSGAPARRMTLAEGIARLVPRLRVLCREAARAGVRVGFEPEPGMLIDRTVRYRRLRDEVGHEALGLTLDLGHVHCLREGPVAEVVRRHADDLVHVHAEDMVAGRHEHLMFGAGEMRYPPILAALSEIGYRGMVAVELSRDSHRAVAAARAAFDYLARARRQEAGLSRSRKNVSESSSRFR